MGREPLVKSSFGEGGGDGGALSLDSQYNVHYIKLLLDSVNSSFNLVTYLNTGIIYQNTPPRGQMIGQILVV